MKSVVLFAIAFLLLSFSCNTTDPPPPPQYVRTIELTAEDASCTEAWLRVKITDGSQPPFDVRLIRDGQTLQTLRLSTPDSLIVDEGLLPNRTYTYKAYRPTDSSTQIAITTMDTTSSNWVFDPPVLLGDGSSSVLYDVAIINDTLAYAVGAIYKRDSLGNWDPNAYNMAKWDGNAWELMRIQFYTICGQSSRTPYPAKAIFAFSETDIWIAMDGDQVARWNGTAQTATMCLPVSFAITKLWGENPNSMYAVGEGGNIMHYASGTWRRLESGTDVPLVDIHGGDNLSLGENVILACASDRFAPTLKRVLRILPNSTGVDSIAWGMPHRRPQSAWVSETTIFVAGDGIFTLRMNGMWQVLPTPLVLLHRIRGVALNSAVAVGEFGLVLCWNGVSFREFPETSLSTGNYASVSMTTNLIIAVGRSGSRAVVAMGRK